MAFKKRRFYFDHLIFALHYFSLVLLSWVMLDWAATVLLFLSGHDGTLLAEISSKLFLLVIPLLYAVVHRRWPASHPVRAAAPS